MVSHPDPGFTANELGDEFGKTRQWADKQLKKLEANGLVTSKNPGGRSKWYWPTTKGRQLVKSNEA